MSVRKRTWVTRRGERREVWIADYSDQQGGRHIRTFSKKDADEYPVTDTLDPPISSQRAGLPGTSSVDPGKRAIKTLDLVDQLDRLVLCTTREFSCDDKIGFIRIGLNHPRPF